MCYGFSFLSLFEITRVFLYHQSPFFGMANIYDEELSALQLNCQTNNNNNLKQVLCITKFHDLSA